MIAYAPPQQVRWGTQPSTMPLTEAFLRSLRVWALGSIHDRLTTEHISQLMAVLRHLDAIHSQITTPEKVEARVPTAWADSLTLWERELAEYAFAYPDRYPVQEPLELP
jgi:hypothetical protein